MLSVHIPWIFLDCQQDLDQFNRVAQLDETEAIEYYATPRNEPYFPTDISRSGHHHPNLHVICRAASQSDIGMYVEMVWIHCELLSHRFLSDMRFDGTVDTLKRVEVAVYRDGPLMRCGRFIYRMVPEDCVVYGSYFTSSIGLTPSSDAV